MADSRRLLPWSGPVAVLLFGLVTSLVTACAGTGETAAPEGASTQDAGAAKAPVEARAAVDRAVATTGDVLTYTVTVDYDPAYEVEIPEAGADIAGFRILDTVRQPAVEKAGRRVEELSYQLRADLVGSYVLPPLTISWKAKDSAEPPQQLETSAIFVEVESVLPEGEEVTDIRGLKPLRQVDTPLPWWQIGAAAAALLLLAGGGWWWWRRAHRRPALPPPPAHEVAFRALDALRGTDFSDPAAVRRFYFEISEVLRAYVEARYGLNATDLTTEEILPQLARMPQLPPEPRASLERFLVTTDRVKFAAYEPTEEEIHAAYEAALGFVEQTRPAAEEAAPEAAEGAAPASEGSTDSKTSSGQEAA